MHWIIQQNRHGESAFENFLNAIRILNIPHTIVNVIPFVHDIEPDVNPPNPVLVWGSTSMDMAAKKKKWIPGTFLNELFDMRFLHDKIYRDDLLNGDATFHELGDVPHFSGSRFIRPVHDMKSFAGMVITSEDFEEWKKLIIAISDGYATVTPQTLVMVAEPKEIECEHRFFVVAGKVVAGSLYRKDGRMKQERVTEGKAWTFAQKMAREWQPALAFVIDIANLNKVIEINCINSSGFYESDMFAVVQAIQNETLAGNIR